MSIVKHDKLNRDTVIIYQYVHGYVWMANVIEDRKAEPATLQEEQSYIDAAVNYFMSTSDERRNMVIRTIVESNDKNWSNLIWKYHLIICIHW